MHQRAYCNKSEIGLGIVNPWGQLESCTFASHACPHRSPESWRIVDYEQQIGTVTLERVNPLCILLFDPDHRFKEGSRFLYPPHQASRDASVEA